jgi:hypothetical protein
VTTAGAALLGTFNDPAFNLTALLFAEHGRRNQYLHV